MTRLPNGKHLQCICCGRQTYFMCTRCPKSPPLHMSTPDGLNNSCFLHYHNEASFGYWKGNWNLKAGAKRNDWKYPTEQTLREATRQMKRLHQSVAEEDGALLIKKREPHAPAMPPTAAQPPVFTRTIINNNSNSRDGRYSPPINPDNCI